MSATPRTADAAFFTEPLAGLQIVPADFARQLETELNEVREIIKTLKAGSIVLMEQRAQLKAELEHRNSEKDGAAMMQIITERDHLRKIADAFYKAWEAYKVFPSLANERLFKNATDAYFETTGNKLSPNTKEAK